MNPGVHSFLTPKMIHFGWGAVRGVGEIVASIHPKAFLVSGAKSARASGALDRIEASLASCGVTVHRFMEASQEPTSALVDSARAAARKQGCGVVVAVGGGSALDLDLGKAVAGLYYSAAPVHQHMQGATDIPVKTLPWIAIPTTAGSGAEVTPNAVLTDVETGVKKSLRSWSWLAEAAIVDPELTLSMPPQITAFTGMDALTQAIESFTSKGATPLTDGISLEAACQIANNLLRAYTQGDDGPAREAVAWGAMMAGIALANARLGAVHGFAHPVGTHCGVPHGKACAILLPWVMEFNLDTAAAKYARLARALKLTGLSASATEAAEALILFVRRLNNNMGIPNKLSEVGLTQEKIPSIVEETIPSGSLAANPRPASRDDLVAILEKNL